MTKLKSISIILFLFIFQTERIYCAPSAYSSNCPPLNINNPTTSHLIQDNKNCGLVWVLPPSAGISKISGFTPSANLSMCRALKDNQESVNILNFQIKKIISEIDKAEEEMRIEQEKLFKLISKIKGLEAIPEIKKIKDLNLEINNLEIIRDDLMEKISLCHVDCHELKETYKETIKEIKAYKKEVLILQRNYYEKVDEFNDLNTQKMGQEKKISYLEQRFLDRIQKREELQNTIRRMMKYYDSIEGGYAHLDYDTKWNENIKKLIESYHQSYEFRAMPTRNAKVFANFIPAKGDSKESYMATGPIILSYSFGGLKYNPWEENQTTDYNSLPSHLSGAIRLNLTGACPIYYENYLSTSSGSDLKIATDYNSKILDLPLMINYEYPAAYKFNISAKYNLFKFYQKMVSSTTKGGLFSSKTVHEMSENSLDKDIFELNWEDEEGNYTKDEKKEIEKELKQELITRVLHNMAIPIESHKTDYDLNFQTYNKQSHGCLVLAKGIRQFSPIYPWTMGVSWLFVAADSVFGHDSVINNYKNSQDRTAIERWTTSDVRWVPSTTGFYRP